MNFELNEIWSVEQTRCLKTEQEIFELILPENITLFQKYTHLLENGQDFQKIYVLQNISQLDMISFQNMLPQILGFLDSNDDEVVHQEAGSSIDELLSSPSLELKQKDCISIFHFILKIMQTRTRIIIDIWAIILSKIFHKLPLESTLHEIEHFTKVSYDQFQPTLHRYSSIKLISISYNHFQKHIDQNLQEKIRQTCSDREEIVRMVFTEELLVKVCESLDPHTLEIVWMDKVNGLAYDSSQQVKWASIFLLINLYDRFPVQAQIRRLNFFFGDIFQSKNSDIKLNLTLQLPLLIYKLSKLLTNNESFCLAFQNFINKIGPSQNLEQFSSYLEVLPKCLQVLQSLKEDEKQIQVMSKIENFFDTHLQTQLESVINEEDDIFIADSVTKVYHIQDHLPIPSIIKIWQTFFVKIFDLKPAILLPQLKQNIGKFNVEIGQNTQIKNQILSYFINRLIDLFHSNVNNGSWGNVLYILENIQQILNFSQQQMENLNRFEVIVMKSLKCASAEVRKKSIKNVFIFSLQIVSRDTTDQRDEIMNQIQEQLYNSKNNKLRQAYIDFCIAVSQEFSRSFFQSYNLINSIILQFDQVSSVRYKVPELLYQLYLQFWNSDQSIIQKLKDGFNILIDDRKKVVIQVKNDKIKQNQQAKLYQQKISYIDFSDNQLKHQQEELDQKKITREMAKIKQNYFFSAHMIDSDQRKFKRSSLQQKNKSNQQKIFEIKPLGSSRQPTPKKKPAVNQGSLQAIIQRPQFPQPSLQLQPQNQNLKLKPPPSRPFRRQKSNSFHEGSNNSPQKLHLLPNVNEKQIQMMVQHPTIETIRKKNMMKKN